MICVQAVRDGFVLTTGIFYKDLHDLKLSSNAQVDTKDGLVPERFNNDGTGNVTGAELLLKYKKHKAYVNVGYTFTRSRRRDRTGEDYPSQQDQTHNVNISGAYTWGNYTLATRWRYVTGIPYTPIRGAIYYENADTYVPMAGEKLSARSENFWQLDLRFDRRWIFNTWILSLYLDVQNVTMKDNQVGIAYNFDYSQNAPRYFIPILPTFGIKGEF